MFSHWSAAPLSDFVEIELENAVVLLATSGHYIWVVAPLKGRHKVISKADVKLIEAKKVKIGMTLPYVSSAGQAPIGLEVIDTRMTRTRGLFNPHTSSGSIVVNGIVATTFTNTLPPSKTIHAIATFPSWLVYKLLSYINAPAIAEQINWRVLQMIFNADAHISSIS